MFLKKELLSLFSDIMDICIWVWVSMGSLLEVIFFSLYFMCDFLK